MKTTKSDSQTAIINFFQLCEAPEVSNDLFEVITMLQESDTFTSSSKATRANLFFTLQNLGKLVNDLAPNPTFGQSLNHGISQQVLP